MVKRERGKHKTPASFKQLIGELNMAAKKSLDMGALQDAAEKAARDFRTAKTNLQRAHDAYNKAEEAHVIAQKTLAAGASQLVAQTKVA